MVDELIHGESCSCCAGVKVDTPAAIHNRPGLPAIEYRAGTHGTFLASMLARLSAKEFSALSRLTTRDRDDFSVALCDATATMLDVLTFYQERIANEHYLRTAGERRSILELARLIGHELSPGVAASTWLAFLVQETPGLPGQTVAPAPVPSGTRVQSVPGPDESPQTFETIEAIEARAEWNSLPAQTVVPWIPQFADKEVYLAGVATGLSPGDALLIVGQERLVNPDSERWDVRLVSKVEADVLKNRTRVSWLDGLGSVVPHVEPAKKAPRVYALRQRAALFGHNAPDPNLMSTTEDNLLNDLVELDDDDLRRWKGRANELPSLDLDAAYPKIVADSWVALVSNDTSAGTLGGLPGYVELFLVKKVALMSRTKFGLSGRMTRIVADSSENKDLFKIPDTLVLAQSEELAVAGRRVESPVYGPQLTLAGSIEGLAAGRALAITGKRQRIGIADKASELSIELENGAPSNVAPGDSLQLMATPEKLVSGAAIALTPDEFIAALTGNQSLRLQVRDRDGTIGTLDARGEELFLQASLEKDETISEIVFIQDKKTAVVVTRDSTALDLESTATRNVYDRASVRINANVAPATHGESVREIVGSAAGRAAGQQFMLRQSPVTHVSAATPSGRESSLALRVNDLLWREVPSLFGRGANERVYTTKVDDGGRTAIIFGDGVEGARPPSGQDNIRAIYRKGIGVGGNVSAGKLGTLLTRPLGISGVTNPEAAGGGQDPEQSDEARENAPRTVLTLERAVSIQDYEDFARSFAGIAKAHATWIPSGPGRGIFVTVAGEAGAEIFPSSKIHQDLVTALRNYGDRLIPLRVASYQPKTFRVRASIKVGADFDAAVVLGALESSLRSTFGFSRRRFGQLVSVDELAEVVHRTEGVEAVNVIELYSGSTAGRSPRLFARLPEGSATTLPAAAELLLLDPARPTLEVMS